MTKKVADKSMSGKELVSQRRFVKTAPDKIRRLASLIKGKKISTALDIMKFSNLAAAKPLNLTLRHVLSLAKDRDLNQDDLYILRIRVDEGPKLKRRRIIHQGRSTAILKRMSHITVVLTDKPNLKLKTKKAEEA